MIFIKTLKDLTRLIDSNDNHKFIKVSNDLYILEISTMRWGVDKNIYYEFTEQKPEQHNNLHNIILIYQKI